MSQQSEIFSRYRSLFNTNSVQPTQSETSRRLNNLSFVDFLFELVKATKGQSQFKNIILKGSLSKLKKTDELNLVIRNAIIKQFACDDTLIIQTKYTTKSSLGINIQRNEIDAFGLLGFNPNTSPGKFLYEGNDTTKHSNYGMYIAQSLTQENPLNVEYRGNTLYQLYSTTPNNFIFKFGDFYENKRFGVWLMDYLDFIAPLFNNVNFISILTDIITGSLTLFGNKNKIDMREQSSILIALKKIFGFCSDNTDDNNSTLNSANSNLAQPRDGSFNGESNVGRSFGIGDNNTSNINRNDLNPFDFTFSELEQIEKDASLRSRGVIRFSTCGDLELQINSAQIISGLESLFSNADDSELYSYDSSQDNLTKTKESNDLFDNNDIIPNVENVADFFDGALRNGANDVINRGGTNVIIDFPSINSELQLNILKAIPYALMQMVLSPKTVLIPKLYGVLSGDETPKSVNSFITLMKSTILRIGTTITTLLIENIFDSIKSDLSRLALQLAISYLKQRGVDYLLTLRSLLKLIGLFGGTNGGCGGVLDKLLRLLKLSNFGPMPMLPPPLIFLGGALKPGMNSVAIYNDIKSNLTERGIETAPTLPDGTPNNMMIAIEETVKAMVTHLKSNSTIQTFGISAVGPVSGYGQIQ